jgi:hypothetical protein
MEIMEVLQEVMKIMEVLQEVITITEGGKNE